MQGACIEKAREKQLSVPHVWAWSPASVHSAKCVVWPEALLQSCGLLQTLSELEDSCFHRSLPIHSSVCFEGMMGLLNTLGYTDLTNKEHY